MAAKLTDADSPGNFNYTRSHHLGGAGNTERAYTGLIDDFRIYNALLPEADVQLIYSDGTGDYNYKPVVTLNGDAFLMVEMGSDFTDPGAMATDVEDGDIPAGNITVSYFQGGRLPELVTGVTATEAVSNYSGRLPEDSVNGSGLSNGAHNTSTNDMWMTESGDALGYIVYDLGAQYQLTSLHLWNHNQPNYTKRGVKEVELLVDSAPDGNSFVSVGNFMVGQAPGQDGYMGERVDLFALFGTAPLKDVQLVKFQIVSNHGDGGYSGISEVQFTANEALSVGTLDTSAPGDWEATYTATDSFGGKGTATRDIRVFDPDAPVITLTGGGEVHHEQETVFTDPGYTVADKDGQALDATKVVVTGVVDPAVPGTYVLKYNFTDDSDRNALEETRTVNVSDTAGPVITLVGGDSVKHPLGQPYIEPGYSAEDLVDGSVQVRSSEYFYNQLVHKGFDDGGTQSSLNLTNNGGLLKATPNGEKALVGPLNFSGDAAFINAGVGIVGGDQFRNLYVGYFYAKVAGEYQFGIQREDNYGTLFLDLNQNGLFETDGSAGNEWLNDGYDAKGYFKVELMPGLHKFGAAHQETSGGSNIEVRFSAPAGAGPTSLAVVNPSASAQDGLWLVGNPISTGVLGNQTITYTAKDAAGNVATVTRTVEIIDPSAKPVITLAGRSFLNHEQYTDYTDHGYTVADADGNPLDASGLLVEGVVDTAKPGVYTLQYTFYDSNGIPADSKVREVTVADTLAPTLELVGDAEITHVQGEVFTDPGATLLTDPEGDLHVTSNASLPTQSLFMHLDASNVPGYNPGDPVPIWRDLSGNGNDLDDVRGDPALVADAIQGMPAVYLDGNDFMAASGTDVERQYSIFTVSRMDGVQKQRLISSRNRNWLIGYNSGYEDLFHPEGWATASNQVPVSIGPHLYEATSTGSQVAFWADGKDLTTTSGRNVRVGDLQLGGYGATGNAGTGYVAEVLVYRNHVVSEQEHLSIRAYLASKYGLLGFPQVTPPDLSQPGEHTILYTARDAAGNVGTVTRKVTVTPATGFPIITLEGEALVTLEYDDVYTVPGATVKDTAGTDLDAGGLIINGSLDTAVLGTHIISYDYIAEGGLEAETVYRTITVVDTTGPEISLVGDPVVRVEAGGSFTDPGATANDARQGDVQVFSDVEVNPEGLVLHLDAGSFKGVLSDNQNIPNRWDDLSGNGNHADTRVSDPKWVEAGLNGLPVVNFDGDDMIYTRNIESQLPDGYTIFSVARYTAGDGRNRVIASRNRNWLFGFHGGNVRRFYAEGWVHQGNQADTDWHAHIADVNTSDQGNFWVDGQQYATNSGAMHDFNFRPKNIVLGGYNNNQDRSKSEVAELLIYNGVLAAEDRDILANYLNTKYNLNGGGDFTSRFDLSEPGTHTVTYIASDSFGNTSTKTRKIIVSSDPAKPYIVLNGDPEVTIEAASIQEYTDPGAVALDSNGDELDNTLVGQGTVDPLTPGTYTLTYNHADADPIVRTIIVEDTLGPAITLSGDSPLQLFLDVPFVDPGGTAVDQLDGDTPVYSDYLPVPDFLRYEYFQLGHAGSRVNFDNNGGLLTSTPTKRLYFSDGPNGAGLHFPNDTDYRKLHSTPHQGDNFQVAITGTFRALREGTYEFEGDKQDGSDYLTTWIDKDQDGIFERNGDLGDERMTNGDKTSTVYLYPGIYRVAFGLAENTGNSVFRVRFRTPEGAGPSLLTNVQPGAPGQEGLWGTYPRKIDTSVPGEHTIQYFSDDQAGNRTTLTRKVIVSEDTEKPIILLVGGRDLLLHAGHPFVDPGYELTDFEGNPLDASLVTVTGVPDGTQLGEFMVRYGYTDPDGHIADSQSRLVTVADETPPVITIVGANPFVLEQGQQYDDPGAVAEDAFDGVVIVGVEGIPTGFEAKVDIGANGQRVAEGWVGVSGANNNTNNTALAFTDVIAPSGDSFQMQISNVDWRDRGNSTSNENIAKAGEDFVKHNGGDITITLRGLPAGELEFTTYHLDPTNTQCAQINIHVTDVDGNDVLQQVTGNANLNPQVNGITVQNFEGTSATFTVNSSGSEDVVIRLDGQGGDTETPINGFKIFKEASLPSGSFDITYIAVDANGNRSEATRTVTITDGSNIPEITLLGDPEITIDAGTTFQDPGVSLTDRFGAGADPALVSVSGKIINHVLGTYTLAYDYTDPDGNAAITRTRSVVVTDQSPPVINLVGGDTVYHQLGNEFEDPGYSATDFIDGATYVSSSMLDVGRIRVRGYQGGENDTILDLDGNGGLLLKTPRGEITDYINGPRKEGIRLIGDGNFRSVIPQITTNDNFQMLFDGHFYTSSGGLYQFGMEDPDDAGAFWVDVDGDGVFEHNGDKGSELMNPGWQFGYRDVELKPGYHRYAIAFREGGSGSRVDARYRAISGVGPGSLAWINPAWGQQTPQWVIYNPIDPLALGEQQIT